MSKKSEFVQLETDDDVASVRDRLSFIRGQRVLLIWPEEGTVLTRKLDLVLIQREAMRRAIRLALVTHDPHVMKNANELNISTFETIGDSERGRWKRGRSKVFINRFQRPSDEPEPEALMDVASRVRIEEPPEAKLRRRVSRVLILLLLLGVTMAAAYIVLPSATVVLIPAQELVESEIRLVADPARTSVDMENDLIPATRLSVAIEETGTIPTTGTQDFADLPATGSVVFINNTNARVTIPAGTTVSTSAGEPILFRTTEEAVLSAGVGFQLEAPIEALQSHAGPVGNVGVGLINTVVGPLADSITVRNLTPTSGGESKTLRAVSEDDRERLIATVRQQLQARAYTEMLPRLTETQFIILETVHIEEERSDWLTFSANPGDVADTLTLTMRAVVEATAVDEGLAQQIAITKLSAQVPRGREIRAQSVSYERGPVESIDEQGRVTFTYRGSGLVEGRVNVIQLQERLAGRGLDDAMRYLLGEVDLAENTTPQILVRPEWLAHMPLLPVRITIRVQDVGV